MKEKLMYYKRKILEFYGLKIYNCSQVYWIEYKQVITW